MKAGRRIGGSDIPKLLGVSPYGNEHDVFLRIVEGLVDPGNKFTWRGELFEPVLRGIGYQRFGLGLEPATGDYWPHPSLSFAHAQIDDLAIWKGCPVTVNYKTASIWAKGWGPDGGSDVPEHVHAQLAWEMLCARRELAIALVGFGADGAEPQDFSIERVVRYVVPRDERFEELLVSVAEEFWNGCVLPRRAPTAKPLGRNKIQRAA